MLKGELDPERSDLGCPQSQAKEMRLGVGGGRVDPKRSPAQEADCELCQDRQRDPACLSLTLFLLQGSNPGLGER